MKYIIEGNKVRIVFSGKERLENKYNEVKDFLSYYSTNYWHSTKYKTYKATCENGHEFKDTVLLCPQCKTDVMQEHSRLWDGKISLFYGYTFDIGFLPYMLEEFGGTLNNTNTISKPVIYETGLSLYPHQKEAVDVALNNTLKGVYFPRGIINAATNSGKTYMMAEMYLRTKKNTIVLVHSSLLFDQHYETFTSLGINVSKFGNGSEEIGEFTLCMYETLLNRSSQVNIKMFISSCDMLLVDECHRASSSTYQKLLKKFKAYMCYFFSGTPLDSDSIGDVFNIIAMSGSILYSITNKYLIENGYSAKIKIYMHSYVQDMSELEDFGERIKFSGTRANKIVDILKTVDSCILAVNHKTHFEFIQDFIDFETTYSSDSDKQDKLEKFDDGEIGILSATMILKEGINLKTISNIVLAMGGRSKITILQLIGRGLRKHGLKELAVHDFYDKGRNIEEHTKRRIEIYEEQGFEIVYL